MLYVVKTQYMFIHDVLGVIIGKKTQNGSRGATSSVVYQNEGHTINEYNELHEHSELLLCLHAGTFCLYVFVSKVR